MTFLNIFSDIHEWLTTETDISTGENGAFTLQPLDGLPPIIIILVVVGFIVIGLLAARAAIGISEHVREGLKDGFVNDDKK